MTKKTTGIIYGALASACYGTNPLFGLPLYAGGLDVNSVLFYRYFFAVILYWIWLVFIKRTSLKLNRNQILPLVVLGLFFSLSSLTLFEAFRYIDAGIACTILFIYPIIVAVIMAAFFKEKITRNILLAIILTSLGILFLYNGGSVKLNLSGVLIVLSSALLYALYIVCVKKIKAVKYMNSSKLTFYVMLFGLSVYIINLKFCTNIIVPAKPFLWLYAVALAIFPTIISIETITIAIKLAGATTTAILGALEPLTAVFFGAVVFHEQLTIKIICGILLVLTGVLTAIKSKKCSG